MAFRVNRARPPTAGPPSTADQGAPLGDVSDAGLRPIVWQIAFLGFTSACVAACDSASIAGIAGLFAGSIDEGALRSATDKSGLVNSVETWLSHTWVVCLFVVLTFAFNTVNTVAHERLSARWEVRRRTDLVDAFRAANIDAQTSRSGAGLSVAAEQISQASNVIGGVAGLLNTILRGGFYLAVSFAVSPSVSVVAIVAGGALVVGLRSLTRRTRAMHHRMAGGRAEIGEQIGEMTSSARELHLLNRWDDIAADLRRRISVVGHDRFVSGALATMVGPIYWAGTLFVGIFLATVVRHSTQNLQGLAASGLLLIRALGAAQAAQVMYQQYNDSKPYFDRSLRLIAELRGARRVSGDERAGDQPVLRLEHVSLSYGNDVIASDLDLEIGGIGGVALIGPSGSGKSTTLLALSGFLAPTEGTASADGIPLDLLPSEDLGHTIGFLPQDPRLFRASLRDNTLRPDTDASDDAIMNALDRLALTTTVNGFASGLDSKMGRGGEGFSGGELQRFGLVRLAINQPRVWILDEPTSALDRENSMRVTSMITEAMDDHLVIVVTHRPEVLHHCSRVIYMEDGVVLDDGPLEEVSARHPFVASMLAG